MKVLVIGSGGREHALCWKLAQSREIEELYCAPGNGGTSLVATNVPIQSNDLERLLEFSKTLEIDLVVVGPEEPLVLGITDMFEEEGISVFGPDAFSARLEGSKDFAKDFMVRHNIPTAKYKTFTEYNKAIEGLSEFSYPLVIKADGLCLGKGVVICENKEIAQQTLKEVLVDRIFGDEGQRVVIEEFLEGTEASLLCFVSHNRLFPMESAKDYKQIFEDDKGPNTGGVGCYSPSPFFNEEFNRKIRLEVLDRIEEGLEADGHNFTGILFIGFMISQEGPKVLEFNVRFGDPETEVVLPRLESDLLEIFIHSIVGDLKEDHMTWKEEACMTVVLTSGGYPGYYKKGYRIYGLPYPDEDIMVFHNGTKIEGEHFVTNGGRVLSVTCTGEMSHAREKIYQAIEGISFKDMGYRRDIGLFK
ncbi:phosphoribosylamine--glycine ligase [Gudongella sp. SC589]|jgi:phosphoribosylamine--glycine ligase|uniref:phosphoribosylamine--glycine ligase n=1 Tax=Gudongella sp. SC589 TaxID=3385990 RepID=UPI003904CE99